MPLSSNDIDDIDDVPRAGRTHSRRDDARVARVAPSRNMSPEPRSPSPAGPVSRNEPTAPRTYTDLEARDALLWIATQIQGWAGQSHVLSHCIEAHIITDILSTNPPLELLVEIADGGIRDIIGPTSVPVERIARMLLGSHTTESTPYDSPRRIIRSGSPSPPGAPKAPRHLLNSIPTHAHVPVDYAEALFETYGPLEMPRSNLDEAPGHPVSEQEALEDREQLQAAYDQAERFLRVGAKSLGALYSRENPLSAGLLRRYEEDMPHDTGPLFITSEQLIERELNRPRMYNGHPSPSPAELERRRVREPQEVSPYAETIKQSFPSFVCPITHDIFYDPVLASDGHTYERVAIDEWLWTGRITSPVTNERLLDGTVHDNVALRNVIGETMHFMHQLHSTHSTEPMQPMQPMQS